MQEDDQQKRIGDISNCQDRGKLVLPQEYQDENNKIAIIPATGERTTNIWWLVAAVGSIVTATVIWMPSKSGGPLCYPDSIFQGHAFWHIFSSLALGCLFMYMLSEDHRLETGTASENQLNDL